MLVLNLPYMYTLDCFPALYCKKPPILDMLCTVMVHVHILVHCAFTLTFALHALELHMGHN